MPRLNRNGVNIHYEVHGSGPPLILTHGYSLTSEMWQGQIAALSRHHTLILWDMRGHGQSDYPADPARYSEALTVGATGAMTFSAASGRAGAALTCGSDFFGGSGALAATGALTAGLTGALTFSAASGRAGAAADFFTCSTFLAGCSFCLRGAAFPVDFLSFALILIAPDL